MSFQQNENPALVMIAGPNGSGKSTAYENAKLEWEGRDIWIVNPDLLTRRLAERESLAGSHANLAAVERIEKWLYASIDVHQTIGVETVLSTTKYQALVETSQRRGFEFWLIYVTLDSPERNVERVAIRVKKGGHAVLPEKIRDRYWRSMSNLKWFLDKADRAWIFDNSGAEIKLVASKRSGTVDRIETASKLLDQAIEGDALGH